MMKRVIAYLLIVVMIMTMASCTLLRKDDDSASDVFDTCTDFLDCVRKQDDKTFSKYLTADTRKSAAEVFDKLIMLQNFDDGSGPVYKAILDSFSFEIDKDGSYIGDSTARVNVSISTTDLSRIRESGPFKTYDDLESGIKNEKAMTSTSLVIFLKFAEDGYWYISNGVEVLSICASWSDFRADPLIIPEVTVIAETEPETEDIDVAPYKAAVDSVNARDWDAVAPVPYTYRNCVAVEVDLTFSDPDLDLSRVYYTVTAEDKVIDKRKVTINDNLVSATLFAADIPEVRGDKGYFRDMTLLFEFFAGEGKICEAEIKTAYTDRGLETSIEKHDSKLWDKIYFADWFYGSSDVLEFDFFMLDRTYDLELNFSLSDKEGNMIYEDSIKGSGTFVPVIIRPDQCGLEAFSGEYILECYGGKETPVVSASVKVPEGNR